MKKLLMLTAMGYAVCAASTAQAAGFLLREQSAAGMGNAFAGATAGAEDGSYSFYNPAGIIRQAGTQASVNATAIIGDAKGYNATGNRKYQRQMDHVVDKKVLPSVALTHALNSRTSFGLSLSAPFGLVTDYSPTWVGANHGTLSDLTTYNLTPMLAYRATCNLTLGAGLVVQYIDANLKSGTMQNMGVLPYNDIVANMKGDDTSLGYIVGALYEFSPRTRVGVSYRSEVKHKLKGEVSFNRNIPQAGIVNQDIDASVKTPALLTFGAYHDITRKWSVMAEAQKTYWSSFDNLVINGHKSGVLSYTEENWKDVWFFSLGTSYRVSEDLKLRFGVAYDVTPVSDAYRTPRIPDSDRTWFTTGAEYKLTDNMTLNAGYAYIRAKKNRVNLNGTGHDQTRGPLTAQYKGNIHLFAAGINYRF